MLRACFAHGGTEIHLPGDQGCNLMKIQRSLIAAALLALAGLVGNRAAMADTVLYNNMTAQSGTVNNLMGIYGTGTIADTFSLSSPSTVDGFNVDLWLAAGYSPNNFNWQILSDFNYAGKSTSTSSATIVGSGTATTQTMTSTYLTQVKSGWSSPSAFDGYNVAISIPSLSLNANTTYLLLLHNATDYYTYWDTSGGSSLLYRGTEYIGQPAYLTQVTYAGNGGSNSFQIMGSATASPTPNGGGSALPTAAVPEPPSVTLLGLGLVTLLAVGMFRKFNAPAAAGSMIA